MWFAYSIALELFQAYMAPISAKTVLGDWQLEPLEDSPGSMKKEWELFAAAVTPHEFGGEQLVVYVNFSCEHIKDVFWKYFKFGCRKEHQSCPLNDICSHRRDKAL